MKANISITIDDNYTIDMRLDNPAGVDFYTLIGILEKVKLEFIARMTEQPEEVINDDITHSA